MIVRDTFSFINFMDNYIFKRQLHSKMEARVQYMYVFMYVKGRVARNSSDNKNHKSSHKFKGLFVLRKLIFQTRMRSHPVGLDV